jgi:hypothetical protein
MGYIQKCKHLVDDEWWGCAHRDHKGKCNNLTAREEAEKKKGGEMTTELKRDYQRQIDRLKREIETLKHDNREPGITRFVSEKIEQSDTITERTSNEPCHWPGGTIMKGTKS